MKYETIQQQTLGNFKKQTLRNHESLCFRMQHFTQK